MRRKNAALPLAALLAGLTLLASGCGEKQEAPDTARRTSPWCRRKS